MAIVKDLKIKIGIDKSKIEGVLKSLNRMEREWSKFGEEVRKLIIVKDETKENDYEVIIHRGKKYKTDKNRGVVIRKKIRHEDLLVIPKDTKV